MPTADDNVGPPSKVVVMGPAGAGKTTVGQVLARRLGVPFADADDFHTARAVEKMRGGEALTDDDRAPWLDALARLLAEAESGLVLACSALKARYRVQLGVDASLAVRLVYLHVPREVLRARLEDRRGHFVGPELLDSQLASLEVPGSTESYDGTSSPELVVDDVIRRLKLAAR